MRVTIDPVYRLDQNMYSSLFMLDIAETTMGIENVLFARVVFTILYAERTLKSLNLVRNLFIFFMAIVLKKDLSATSATRIIKIKLLTFLFSKLTSWGIGVVTLAPPPNLGPYSSFF